jgi:hypothetical protein
MNAWVEESKFCATGNGQRSAKTQTIKRRMIYASHKNMKRMSCFGFLEIYEQLVKRSKVFFQIIVGAFCMFYLLSFGKKIFLQDMQLETLIRIAVFVYMNEESLKKIE